MKDPIWNVTPEEDRLIEQIVTRAYAKFGQHLSCGRMATTMDIIACHNGDCPLKLRELLEADDFNFAHDVLGIHRHFDRAKMKLDGRFLPRYAK